MLIRFMILQTRYLLTQKISLFKRSSHVRQQTLPYFDPVMSVAIFKLIEVEEKAFKVLEIGVVSCW